MEMSENIEENLTSDGNSFIEQLARYYSEFLATDFKKGFLPKRRFETKDRKGRTSGVALEKYPEILPDIYKRINAPFKDGMPLKIKHQKYKTKLAMVVRTAIDKNIKSIDHEKLYQDVTFSVDEFKKAAKKENLDLELELEKLKTRIERNIELNVVAPIIENLEPVFEKNAANVIDTLLTAQDEIIEQILGDIDDAFPNAFYNYRNLDKDSAILDCVLEYLDKKRLELNLSEYFDGFAANDLFSELRSISLLDQSNENLEYYLYFGEIRYRNHNFPIFFMPLNVSNLEQNGNAFSISFEPRLLINKKAVDYISRELQERSGSKLTSVIDSRIHYIEKYEKLADVLDKLLQPIIRAFQLDGSIAFSPEKQSLKDANVSITNSLNLSLFDKSDESMLTDYEELIDRLSKGDDLIQIVNDLVDSFLYGNPESISDNIDDWWDDTSIPERLVFETPIPLAEEQRKILEALQHTNGRFISVEGPPGTGKSHTISAIAFGAILKDKSILILSDTKEALDVVESKLNDTLSKIRPSDEFVNPILRLGRTGSNFNKVTQNKTIDTLKVQHRAFNKPEEKKKREEQYELAFKGLKKEIKAKIKAVESINLNEVFEYETDKKEFFDDYANHLDSFVEIFEDKDNEYSEHNSAIKSLVNTREQCLGLDPKVVSIAEDFGKDAKALSEALLFLLYVNEKSNSTQLFKKAPEMSADKIETLESNLQAVRDAKKRIFGYLLSRNKLKNVRDDLYRAVGYSTETSDGEALQAEISALIGLANRFYAEMENKFSGSSKIIPVALDCLKENNLPDEVESLSRRLNKIQKLHDDNLIPFLGDETMLEILVKQDSEDGYFFEYFLDKKEKRKKIEKMFSEQEFNYLARKTEIENYNTLELASQIDERVIEFANNHRNDAKTLAKIVRQKKKFPRDKFDLLKTAFPCMICSLRDYAEYIPLDNELFDIIIIDEASQVSIAQAFPAIIRAKKVVVMGDKMQFGNVKTSNASKEVNTSYFNKVKKALEEERQEITTDLEVRVEQLNVKYSVLDFMDNMANFYTRLKKHFRGYPEMISLSSKYFYNGGLQTMKIRGKGIEDVLEFLPIEHDGLLDLSKNTNEMEARKILERVESQYNSGDHRSVAVITPFTEQQTLISQIFSEHPNYQDFLKKLKFRSFTFDTCQGEERDIIYYSFVATNEKDRLSHVLPKSLMEQDEEELDRNKKMQRVNVAFSRGKEKLVFVYSKDINSLTAGSGILNHYLSEIYRAKDIPSEGDLDPNSEAEKMVRKWIVQTPIYNEYIPEIEPQFELGNYLKSLNHDYNHPAYRVDFLLRFKIDGQQRDIIIEYDGFEYHFENHDVVDAGNWQSYQKAEDTERDYVLESYGYKTLRINKYNIGTDPIDTLNRRMDEIIKAFSDPGDALTKKVVEGTREAHQGLADRSYRTCTKCRQDKPFSEFEDKNTLRGYRNTCKSCLPKKSRPSLF